MITWSRGFDLEHLSGTDKFARDPDVRLGRGRVSARVVVRKHDGGGGGQDRQSEHLPRVNQDGVQRPNRDQLVALDSSAHVQEQDGKALAFRVEVGVAPHVQSPVSGDFLGRVAEVKALGDGARPQRNHLILVRER